MTTLKDLNLNKKFNIKEECRYLNYIPNNFRFIVNGTSGCGKTNLVLQLVYKIMDSYLNEINLSICLKTLNQPLYIKFIEDVEDKIKIKKYNVIKQFNKDYVNSLGRAAQVRSLIKS